MQKKPILPTLLALLILGAYLLLQQYYAASPQSPAIPTPGAPTPASPSPAPITPRSSPQDPASPITRPNIAFHSRAALEEHFQKHGREFGKIPIDQYLHKAQSLRDAPATGPILEIKRADGVTTRFNRATGEFLAFNPDYTIRTFFKPNDGLAYFNRQADRDDQP